MTIHPPIPVSHLLCGTNFLCSPQEGNCGVMSGWLCCGLSSYNADVLVRPGVTLGLGAGTLKLVNEHVTGFVHHYA